MPTPWIASPLVTKLLAKIGLVSIKVADANLRQELAKHPAAVPSWFDKPFPSEGLPQFGCEVPTPREFGERLSLRYEARINALEAQVKELGGEVADLPVGGTDNPWRRLAIKFDKQRMTALWYIQALLQDFEGRKDEARTFLATGK